MTYKPAQGFSKTDFVNDETGDIFTIASPQPLADVLQTREIKHIGVLEMCDDGIVLYVPEDHPVHWEDLPGLRPKSTQADHQRYLDTSSLPEDAVLRYRALSIWSGIGVDPFAHNVMYRRLLRMAESPVTFTAETVAHERAAGTKIEFQFNAAGDELTVRETPNGDPPQTPKETLYRRKDFSRQP